MIVIDLLYNLAILVAMSVISGFISNRFDRNGITEKILQGFVFGTAALIGMLYPFELEQGLIFDGRSVILSICGLFFGPISAIISGTMTTILRISMGGPGVYMGVSVIAASVTIGLIFHYWLKNRNKKKTFAILYLMGILVHIAMLILMALLPKKFVLEIFETISATVMLFYPLATVLIGKILKDQEDNSRLLKELSASEEKYKLIAENSADPIILLDMNLNHLFVSPSVYNLYGYTPEEYMALSVEKTVTPESLNRAKSKIEQELSIDKDENTDPNRHALVSLEEYRKDGSIISVESTIRFIRDENANPVAILVVSRDITERIKAEKKINEANMMLEDIINTQPAGIYRLRVDSSIIDSETKLPLYQYDFISSRFADFAGCSINYLTEYPATTLSLIHPDDYESFIKANVEADRTLCRFIWEGRMIINHIIKWVRFESLPRIINDNERLWTGAIIDITQSKEKEKEIYESEETFRRLFEDSTDPIMLFEDYFFDCNNSTLAILGMSSKSEFIGIEPWEISPMYQGNGKLSKDYAFEMVEQAIEYGHNKFEWIHTKVNGEEFYVEVMLTPIVFKGRRIIHVIWRDISERKAAEEIIRKTNQELQAFIEYNPLSIQIVDKEGHVEVVNSSFVKLFGDKPNEQYNIFEDKILEQHNMSQLMNMAKQGHVVSFPEFQFNRYKEKADFTDIDTWIRMVVFSIKNSDNLPEKYIFMHEDITERKQAQAALIESERNYREIFNATSDAIFIHDSASGIIIDVNESMLTMYGYSTKAEIQNLTTDMLSAIEEGYTESKAIEKINESALKHQSTFEWRAKRKNGEVFWAEVSLQSTQIGGKGRTLAVVRDITERKRLEESLQKRIIALTQPLNANENIDFFELFGLDEIQNIQDAFADIAGVASVITYPDGRLITKPSNFCKLCNLIRSTEKGLAKCIRNSERINLTENGGTFIIPCLRAGLYDAGAAIKVGGKHIANWLIGQIQDDGLPTEEINNFAEEIGVDKVEFLEALAEVPRMSKLKFERIAEALNSFANELSSKAYQNILQARFIVDKQKAQDEVLRLNAELEDIVNQRTMELKAAMEELQDSNIELQTMNEQMMDTSKRIVQLNEELNEALATKDRFFSIIAHDLRNPFVVLLNNSEILQNYYDRLDDETKLKKINDIKEASSYTYTLLENLLTWARAQKGNINFVPNVYNAYDIIYMNYLVLKSQAATKRVSINISCPPETTLYCDRDMIDTVIRNLLSNAIKYTNPDGEVEIGVIEDYISDNIAYDCIFIKDSGIGIDDSDIDKLFHIDNKFVRKGTSGESSTGLGLILCKEFIEKHNGKIWVESEIGVGSTFFITMQKA